MPEAADPEKVACFLDVILATHPELLLEAQKAAPPPAVFADHLRKREDSNLRYPFEYA